MPSYTLCADDFALSRGISETIADLAERRCINAVSCMASLPGWAEDAALLAPLAAPGSGVQIGLHLVLSDELPLTRLSLQDSRGRLPSPDRMMALAYLGKLDTIELANEIDAQIVAFNERIGRPPDFVDAHQHVHVHPGVRALVIAATRRHAPHAWIRNPADALRSMVQRPFIGKALGSAFHALGLRRQIARAGLSTNAGFGGHYDFRSDYEQLLPRFFAAAGPRHLVMCHPGAGHLAGDAIADARIAEAAVLRRQPLQARLQSWGIDHTP